MLSVVHFADAGVIGVADDPGVSKARPLVRTGPWSPADPWPPPGTHRG